MYVISVACSKGGSGKTTVAINLAVSAAKRGWRVLLVDCDPQGSTRKWFGLRTIVEGPEFVESRLRDLSSLVSRSKQQGFDLVIVDVAGNDSVAFFQAFRATDLVVIPVAPVKIEAEEAGKVQRAAKAASCDHITVLVRTTQPSSWRNRYWIEKYPKLVAPVVLRHLIAYADSYARGEGVLETYPGSVPSIEVEAMLDYLMTRITGGVDGQ